MELVKPDTSQQQAELAKLQQMSIAVVDRESHDLAIDYIRQAEKVYIPNVEAHFAKYERPLKEALAAITDDKRRLIEPAKMFATEHRKKCADWQDAERRRIQEEAAAEAKRLAEEAAERPWEAQEQEIRVPSITPTSIVASNGASLRNTPWKARVLDIDKLWEAAIKDSRYREYFIVDEKALNAKAKSMGEAFNIPGCESYRGTTLMMK